MDMDEKDKFGIEKTNEDPMNYHSPNISPDWRFAGANLPNSSMDLMSMVNPIAVSKGDLIGSTSCSSASMVDTFGPILWDHPTNSQNLGFNDINVQNGASTSSTIGIRKGSLASLRSGVVDRTLDMGWNPPSSLLKGSVFLPDAPALLPQALSQFPADSAFIQRAAKFSCFSGHNLSDSVNPFIIPESTVHYSRTGGLMQGPQEVFMDTGFNSVSGGGQSQKNELNVGEASKEVSLPLEHEITEGSPLENERSESLVRSLDEVKGVGGSGNESDEADLSGSGGGGGQGDQSMLEGIGMEPSPIGGYPKKRKRGGQNVEHGQTWNTPDQPGEAGKNTMEIQQKGDQNPTSATNKTTGKHGKQGSQASDPSKEEYIHIRARRGQATNSHSLAERVRREKISERMKFLQDLVPGCSKVTGKAVMLDEIINYVQSLQRQVEFLSMKLATVNPRLDFNFEGQLAKDLILQSRAGPSSTLGFPSDMPMTYPQLLSQPGIIQSGLPGMRTSSDILRRTINSQLTHMTGGFKEVTQVSNVWDDELHNVVQMNFGTNAPPDSQDVNGVTQ